LQNICEELEQRTSSGTPARREHIQLLDGRDKRSSGSADGQQTKERGLRYLVVNGDQAAPSGHRGRGHQQGPTAHTGGPRELRLLLRELSITHTFTTQNIDSF